jgi:hypothetical protein
MIWHSCVQLPLSQEARKDGQNSGTGGNASGILSLETALTSAGIYQCFVTVEERMLGTRKSIQFGGVMQIISDALSTDLAAKLANAQLPPVPPITSLNDALPEESGLSGLHET